MEGDAMKMDDAMMPVEQAAYSPEPEAPWPRSGPQPSSSSQRAAPEERARGADLIEEGSRLAATGQLDSALECFEQASKLGADDEQVKRSMNQLHRKLVPRWHFAMLNDGERNEAFQRALRQAIGTTRATVLDVGAGTGLLAMMAARADAGAVVTCEAVRPIAQLAREIIAANGLDERIALVPKMSMDLVVGQDLATPADILVTETVDCGLLGEGIIPIVRHARAHLLTPRATIIPAQARIFFRLLSSRSVHHNNFAFESGGFDVSSFNQFSTKSYFPVRLRGHRHAFLSPTTLAFDFDFARGSLAPRTRSVSVEITRSGRVHGVAFWFELDLGQGLMLTNEPGNRRSHWMQAVQCFEVPVDVEREQSVTLECSHDDTSVRFAIL
jgi:type II protein arginine methyltransferase